MKKDKNKIRYYTNEKIDDFASKEIHPKSLPADYNYKKYSTFARFLGKIFYHLAHPIVYLIVKFCYSAKVYNKDIYKALRNTGYYIYSNHVVDLDAMFAPALIDYKKFTSIIAGHEAFSIGKILSWMITSLGAFPIPNKHDKNMYNLYVDYMKKEIKKGHQILIFPEAHIWPYCNFIRNFSHSSFRYPVLDNAPIITATTTFIQRKHRKPKVLIYLDGPFYVNKDLPTFEEKVDDLASRAFIAMSKRANIDSNYEYIKYIKK